LGTEHYEISLLANAAALIKQYVARINWVGFYILKNKLLILGPFQGRVACNPIRIGCGVCGRCAAEEKTIVVRNVHEFDGHIPCDEATNSEIVIPLFIEGKIYGVLDLDSKSYCRFSPVDKRFLEQIAIIIAQNIKRIKDSERTFNNGDIF